MLVICLVRRACTVHGLGKGLPEEVAAGIPLWYPVRNEYDNSFTIGSRCFGARRKSFLDKLELVGCEHLPFITNFFDCIGALYIQNTLHETWS